MEQTAEYRPVSAWAVAGLLAGACSALAVVTRFAWVLPLLGIGLSVAALIDIARPGAAKAGRPLALAGLALAIGFGAQAVTTAAVDRWIVSHRACAAATVWIDAVREGRMAEAVGVSVLPPVSSVPNAAADETNAERIERFTTLPAVRVVAACGDGACVPRGLRWRGFHAPVRRRPENRCVGGCCHRTLDGQRCRSRALIS